MVPKRFNECEFDVDRVMYRNKCHTSIIPPLIVIFLIVALDYYYSYSVFSGCGTGYYSVYPNPTSCECEPCPMGTYNDRANAQECTSCQAGFTTFQEGSTSRSKCLGRQ